jgi:MYXO-CTERM domain-containing protein
MIAGSEYDPSDYPAGDDAPSPEPGLLGVLGLGGIAMIRRRRTHGKHLKAPHGRSAARNFPLGQ